jgi:hypothetical protein
MIIFLSSDCSCETGGRKAESLTYFHNKNLMVLGQAILVDSEAAPGRYFTAFLTHSSPLTASDGTKRSRYVQISLNGFSYNVYVAR